MNMLARAKRSMEALSERRADRMSKATEVGSLAAPGKKHQHVSLQTRGGSSLLANGFMTLLLVIGYAVVGATRSSSPSWGSGKCIIAARPACCVGTTTANWSPGSSRAMVSGHRSRPRPGGAVDRAGEHSRSRPAEE